MLWIVGFFIGRAGSIIVGDYLEISQFLFSVQVWFDEADVLKRARWVCVPNLAQSRTRPDVNKPRVLHAHNQLCHGQFLHSQGVSRLHSEFISKGGAASALNA